MRGPNNPRWRGGKAMNYGPGWKRLRQQARDRDKVCTQCGKTPEENGRALDVHHINPFRYSGDNRLEDLLSMCRSCHMRADDHGRRGAAKFAGPQQLELRPVSQRDRNRIKSQQIKARRRELREKARALNAEGKSLRQIARAIGVSHQTVANWLNDAGEERQTGTG